MGKKRNNPNPNQHRQNENIQQDRVEPSMKAAGDSMDLLENLKSLNAVLIKQAHELRLERSSLVSVNEVLELDNRRLSLEKTGVEDVAFSLDLEKEVMEVVVRGRLGDVQAMVDREVRALKERDALKVEVEARIRETATLKAEILGRENEIVQVLHQLEEDKKAVEGSKVRRDTSIQILEKDNDSMNITLVESLSCNDSLKDQIALRSREKNAIELKKNDKLTVVGQLEKQVFSFRESALVLRADVQRLQEMVIELEKSNAELMQQRDGLSMELSVLNDQNTGNEDRIRNLLRERAMLTQTNDESSKSDLGKTLWESEKVKDLLEAEIVDLCEACGTEFGEMQEMAYTLRNKLEWTQKGCENQIEEKKKLVTQLVHLRIELEAGIAERVRNQNNMQSEKKNVQSLTQNLVELEKKVDETAKEIQQLENEKSKVIETKEAFEAQVELLIKEKDLVQKRLEYVEEGVIKSMVISESANTMSDELHTFVGLLGEDERSPTLQTNVEKPFLSEMEGTKNAFHSRESMIANMKKQLEMMKHSVAEAHKRKSLWKFVFSSISIFADLSRRH